MPTTKPSTRTSTVVFPSEAWLDLFSAELGMLAVKNPRDVADRVLRKVVQAGKRREEEKA